MKFKAIILEGADCCGKTTFAKELYNRTENAILVHFPRVDYSYQTKEAIQKLTNTFYNPEYMEKFKSYGKYEAGNCFRSDTFWNMNTELLSIFEDNISYNAEDKNEFLHFLNIAKEEYKEYELLKNDPESDKETVAHKIWNIANKINNILGRASVSSKLHGKETHKDSRIRTEQLKYFIAESEDNTITVIFDRFMMSGDVYNYSVPITIYKEIIENIKKEYLENHKNFHPDDNHYDYEEDKKEVERIFKRNIYEKIEDLYKKEVKETSKLIKLCNTIFSDANNKEINVEHDLDFDGKPILSPINITHLIFKTNENLVKFSQVDKNRKFDDYDKNNDIQQISRLAFENFINGPVKITGINRIEEKYFIKSIVVDSNEYIEFKADDPKFIKQNDKCLDEVFKKIDYLKNIFEEYFIQRIVEIKNQRRFLFKALVGTSSTKDFGFKKEIKPAFRLKLDSSGNPTL